MAGAHTDQRLNLSTLWEGPRKKCRGFKPDPGNLAVRDYRGASGNVRHGGIGNPSCNRKSRNGNPPPTAGRARFLSQCYAAKPRAGSEAPVGAGGETGFKPKTYGQRAGYARFIHAAGDLLEFPNPVGDPPSQPTFS